jgi:hypothetical protein
MDQTTYESDLKTALASFETRLSTPIISGELAGWMGEVQKAWVGASSQIGASLSRLHPGQFEQIAQQDQEMFPQIERLKVEDEAIAAERERIGNMVLRDAQHVPKLEPDEGKAKKHVQNLIDEGLALVTRVRKQEVAIETWLMEAFNRDRGAGD